MLAGLMQISVEEERSTWRDTQRRNETKKKRNKNKRKNKNE